MAEQVVKIILNVSATFISCLFDSHLSKQITFLVYIQLLARYTQLYLCECKVYVITLTHITSQFYVVADDIQSDRKDFQFEHY